VDAKMAGELLGGFLVCITVLLGAIVFLARRELTRLVEILDRIPNKEWFERVTKIAEEAVIELLEHRLKIEALERKVYGTIKEGE
jgi:hypothetical protein